MTKPKLNARSKIKGRGDAARILLETSVSPGPSSGFAALTATRRQLLANDLATLVTHVGQTAGVATNTVQSVDFPKFVSDLLNGVFDSMAASSIEQMEAYTKLVAEVAKSAESFAQDNTSPAAARDWLTQKFPELVDDSDRAAVDPTVRKKFRARRTKTAKGVSTSMLVANVALRATAKGSSK